MSPEPARTCAVDRDDLASRSAIHDLVVEFYREVVNDDLLGPVFEEVAEVDWAEHIPKLVDYWCNILLGEGHRLGSIMPSHRDLHAIAPVRVDHCDRWFDLWEGSVRASWHGPIADHAIAHAGNLMSGMARHVFGVAWSSDRARV